MNRENIANARVQNNKASDLLHRRAFSPALEDVYTILNRLSMAIGQLCLALDKPVKCPTCGRKVIGGKD